MLTLEIIKVIDYTHELMEKIPTFAGKPMNLSAWFNYWSFDVMGDFAFGKNFNMIKTGKITLPSTGWKDLCFFLAFSHQSHGRCL